MSYVEDIPLIFKRSTLRPNVAGLTKYHFGRRKCYGIHNYYIYYKRKNMSYRKKSIQNMFSFHANLLFLIIHYVPLFNVLTSYTKCPVFHKKYHLNSWPVQAVHTHVKSRWRIKIEFKIYSIEQNNNLCKSPVKMKLHQNTYQIWLFKLFCYTYIHKIFKIP